jgi:uncharacterized lipoprotein YddW (UPF0748 family)
MKVGRRLIGPVLAGGLLLLLATVALAQGTGDIFFPIIYHTEAPTPTPIPPPPPTPPPPPPGHMVEFRGLWVTRFDWMTSGRPATPATVDRIVDDAAYAGFNALLFQVRGEADAYYASSIEPWGARLTGTLGQNPGWDPLAYMISRAHARGLQVHAYINVYPVWLGENPPPITQPLHLYYLLAQQHGMTGDRNNGLQWDTNNNVIKGAGVYQRATPASLFVDDHLMAVTHDLISRYDLDGIHLDHARYAGGATSCDPVSEQRSGVRCFTSPPQGYASYGDWQRAQINGTISKFYRSLFTDPAWAAGRRVNLSAAVWFYYDVGRNTYYQDSKAWLRDGYIDTIMPMLYGSFDTSVSVWAGLAEGFQRDNAGRFVFPGIAGTFSDFNNIAGRIEASRSLGTQGHAIFSYGGLADRGYFDDLANGPYRIPAVPPAITWHP